jgi:hypothetical protein
MKRLSGKRTQSERKNWPTYMRNPAILKLTGDTEGFRDFEKFDRERDLKKYEKIKKLKEEERDRVQLSTVDLSSAFSPATTESGKAPVTKKSAKKGEANLAFENETTADSKSVKKLTRQKAFNYEEQPQLEDLEEFKEGLTPLPSPSPSERDSGPSPEPNNAGAKKTPKKKASNAGSKGNEGKKGRVKEVAKKK